MIEDHRGRNRRYVRALARAGFTAAVIAAGVMTAGPLVRANQPTDGLDAQEPPPLTGHWRTIANGDRVYRILRDGDTVWSATDSGGLVRWNVASGAYRQYLYPQDGLPSNDVYDVASDGDGGLWLATGGGLSRFDPAEERFRTITPATSPGMPALKVSALEPTTDGRLWVGFSQGWDFEAEHPRANQGFVGTFADGGLALFDPSTGEWSDEAHAELVAIPGSAGSRYATVTSENITDLELTDDGILWVASRPYLVWEPERCPPGETCTGDGAWVATGGGLAATKDGEWQQWAPEDGTGSCFSIDIADLAADSEGRMWVATRGHGVQVMTEGLRRTTCASQTRYGRERLDTPGLRGLIVWSIDHDDEGRVWIGHSDGPRSGRGVAILDHNNTLEDWATPWDSDDIWTFLDFDGVPGKSNALVTALDVGGAEPRVLGTRDDLKGDGHGIRLYRASDDSWEPLRTGDRGLPSNQVVDIAYDPTNMRTWFALRHRGVAQYDASSDTWEWWPAFANTAVVADVIGEAEDGDRRVRVSLADLDEFNQAFPDTPRLARFGSDPTIYEVVNYSAPRGNDGPYIYTSPYVENDIRAGVPVYRVGRGPASDDSGKIAVDGDGGAWVGGQATIWREGQRPGTNCATFPQCYLDGGLGYYDGSTWTVFNDKNSELPTNGVGAVQVNAVTVDLEGRIWAGTGDGRSVGDGIGVYEPETGTWTKHNYKSGLVAGDGIADFDIDSGSGIDGPTGHVYTAHHPVNGFVTLPGGGQQQYFDGGGVGRWNGGAWLSWTKPDASIRAYGEKGILESVLVDRVNGRIWAGGWDGNGESFHWQTGKDLHAILNWCPVDACVDSAWRHHVWADEGTVAALTLDDLGRVWAGINRDGAGLAPPIAGIKVLVDDAWKAITPENAALVGREIKALESFDRWVWAASLRRGVSLYDSAPLPTATPTPTASATPTATATLQASPTITATTTGPTPTPPASETPTADATETPTATVTPGGGCPPGAACPVFLPWSVRGS